MQLALRSLAAPQRESLIEQTVTDEKPTHGVFAAWGANEVVAAIWYEIQPGNAASVWPPQIVDGAVPTLTDDLLAFALHWLAAQGTEMVQSLLVTDVGKDAECFRRAGFDHCCDLLYLASSRAQFPTAPLATRLRFRQAEPTRIDELARLIEATYEQTLDCPVLNGRRDCSQVLAGYRANCPDDLRDWFIAEHDDQSVGCVLLANRDGLTTWELIYMGVVPSARGRGWGIEMVRQAQWLVGGRGGEHLLLAVDAANVPALRLYAAAGFVSWDRRSVFLKFLPQPGRTSH